MGERRSKVKTTCLADRARKTRRFGRTEIAVERRGGLTIGADADCVKARALRRCRERRSGNARGAETWTIQSALFASRRRFLAFFWLRGGVGYDVVLCGVLLLA